VTRRAWWVCAALLASACSGPGAAAPAERAYLQRPLGRALAADEGSGSEVLDSGSDAARRALFDLLEAIVRGDEPALRRVLAEEPVGVEALRRGSPLPVSPRRREDAIRTLLLVRRAGLLPDTLALWDLVDPSRVAIERVDVSRAPGGGLEPGDLIVRFEVDEVAWRAFGALAQAGRGVVVVRVEPEGARVVGF
jgi:hypothetical protein